MAGGSLNASAGVLIEEENICTGWSKRSADGILYHNTAADADDSVKSHHVCDHRMVFRAILVSVSHPTLSNPANST